jgi:cobalt-zinc-cadmium efflux system membrane fusion protein
MDASKTNRKYGSVVILAIVVLIGALVVRRQEAETNDNSIAQRDKGPDDVIEATPEQLQQIRVEAVHDQVVDLDLETTGKVGFNEERMTPVFAPYSGRVLELLANKGDLVKAGQPLLVIESVDLLSTVHDLAEARADADKAKIALDVAEKAAERARNLHSLEALATKELQAAESDLARAREDSRRAVAAVAAIRNRLSLFGKSPEEIRQLEESDGSPIDRRIEIRAPLAGTIVDRKVGPGQYIKPDNPDPLFIIGDLSSVWVNADVYETHLPQIRIGAPVTITVAAYPDRQFPARISGINPTVDPATRTIHVRCSVPNPEGLLKPEMFAAIRIGNAEKRKAAAVPSSAVLTQGQESFVLREESTGKFRRLAVKSGREIHGYTVIEQGLTSQDRVVTTGALLLSNGLGGTEK